MTLSPPFSTLTGPFRPAAAGETKSAVIFLHGYGADGEDLISLSPYMAKAMPTTAFYAPHAPDLCEISPFGRQWFSLADYDPDLLRRDPHTFEQAMEALYPGASTAAATVDAFIAEICQHHQITHQNIALVGFSQGSMMALHVALRHQQPIAGVVAFSGAVVGASVLPQQITARPPVLLVHGAQDEVLPIRALSLAEQALTAVGVPHEVVQRPRLGHGIDDIGLERAIDFLAPRLRA